MFKFEMRSKEGNYLYLDDVRVEGAQVVAINRKLSNEVEVYPNPSAGSLMLAASMAKGKTVQLTMLDATGRQVRNLKLNIGADGMGTVNPAQTQSLPRGIYHLHFDLPQGQVQKAWVKE